MADFLISKFSKEYVEHKIYFYTKKSYDLVKFFAFKIGQCCNATQSISFSDAECDLHSVIDCEKEPVYFDFSLLYKKGFDVMKKMFCGTDRYKDFDEPYKRALQTLVNFIRNKETHEKSLIEVMQNTTDLKETDVIIAISEHLLGKLCPEESFFINSKLKGKHLCKCGCKAEIKSKGTGIGNEHVWHGFLDVIFESDGEISSGASTNKRAILDLEDEDSDEEDENSAEEDEIAEVKVQGGKSVEENQAAAQAIVFSILQKNKHPEFDNFLIPFIEVSASHVRIFMYDAENDIFIRCQEEMPIFMDLKKDSLSLLTVITLWMVLHYKYFCSGIDQEKLSIYLEDVKSGFAKHIAACSEQYETLKSCVLSFPVVKKDRCKFNISMYHGISGFTNIEPFPPLSLP